jgi:hypothetical protein
MKCARAKNETKKYTNKIKTIKQCNFCHLDNNKNLASAITQTNMHAVRITNMCTYIYIQYN